MGCAFLNQLVVINNAWRIRSDWDACVFPEDFSDKNRPVDPAPGQTLIKRAFRAQQNHFGGVVYVGGTWPLPQLIGLLAH